MGSERAFKSWEFENAVKIVDTKRDGLYAYNPAAHKALSEARPWKQDPNYFKNIYISAVALIKMVMHARSGGELEVMGLMMGYVTDQTFVVTDAFRLPVEGTETRVNAQNEAYEYMVQFLEKSREAGQNENIVGWYHSHPGYGCWLSGIDVQTQSMQQGYQDPFVAVVVDPDRTISAGKVDIGAFRTYPESYKPSTSAVGEGKGEDGGVDSEGFQTIPLAKMEDFGAHSARYYPLEVSHFKSTLDSKLLEALWNKYWVGTLSSSPLFTNRDFGTKQIVELARKMQQTQNSMANKSRSQTGPIMGSTEQNNKDDRVGKIVRQGNKIAAEAELGLASREFKEKLFNGVGT
ncbi:MAG: COP9 signalosome catalytic subunit rri1 [Alyxoria varia]|nr:MAG: COP9 signalosome catalytic subunit rri1 [Alyxoria varia]